ncbi:hypothetical protein QE390_000709 [Siphonobacter sp. SORGH_AS 1065]|nr:hypothetical protein [Siphonobacter sp. SORGH_AS_1065]
MKYTALCTIFANPIHDPFKDGLKHEMWGEYGIMSPKEDGLNMLFHY